MKAPSSYARIYATVRRIPKGRVASYGQVAALAGLPQQARQVGYALAALRRADRGVPWQRVVNARGEISARGEPGAEEVQRLLLELEGVRFDEAGRIELSRYGWRVPERQGRAASNRHQRGQVRGVARTRSSKGKLSK